MHLGASAPPGWPWPEGVPGLSGWGSGRHHLQGLRSFWVRGCHLDSPPYFWGTETRLSQRGSGGCPAFTHRPPARPTHHPGRGTGLQTRRNLRARAGVRSDEQGTQREGEAGGGGGAYRTWGRTRCGPRSGWPSGSAARMHSGPSHLGAVSGLWGTSGSWARGEGAGRACRACGPCAWDTPTPPPRPLCPHTWAGVRGLLPGPLLSWRECGNREAGRGCGPGPPPHGRP